VRVRRNRLSPLTLPWRGRVDAFANGVSGMRRGGVVFLRRRDIHPTPSRIAWRCSPTLPLQGRVGASCRAADLHRPHAEETAGEARRSSRSMGGTIGACGHVCALSQVIPAKAGNQHPTTNPSVVLGPRLRGDDSGESRGRKERGLANAALPVLFGRRRVRPRPVPSIPPKRARGTPGVGHAHGPMCVCV
jgi:hypothetical protein